MWPGQPARLWCHRAQAPGKGGFWHPWRPCGLALCSLFQETFDAGLQAFQQEGIANITALKDQLLAAKHIQSKAIEARHASLMKRWSQLLANSATRKKKLLEAQSHFRKVRAGPCSAPPARLQEALHRAERPLEASRGPLASAAPGRWRGKGSEGRKSRRTLETWRLGAPRLAPGPRELPRPFRAGLPASRPSVAPRPWRWP